jgi:hypothetical protein
MITTKYETQSQGWVGEGSDFFFFLLQQLLKVFECSSFIFNHRIQKAILSGDSFNVDTVLIRTFFSYYQEATVPT